MKLNGRTVVVTGGTSGIGYELVNILAHKAEKVIVVARNQGKLDAMSKAYSNICRYKCDLNNRQDLESTVDRIIQEHPDVSVVINNAGIQNVPTFLDDEFNFDGIEKEIQVNLIAPVWICSLFLGHFIESKKESAFVNVTSGLAFYPKTTSAVYCASKAGLRNFSTSLRYQLEGSCVSVFEAIMPIVDTPMTRGRGRNKMKADKAAQALVHGLEKNKKEIFIGISKLIPIVSRISPKLMASILKRG